MSMSFEDFLNATLAGLNASTDYVARPLAKAYMRDHVLNNQGFDPAGMLALGTNPLGYMASGIAGQAFDPASRADQEESWSTTSPVAQFAAEMVFDPMNFLTGGAAVASKMGMAARTAPRLGALSPAIADLLTGTGRVLSGLDRAQNLPGELVGRGLGAAARRLPVQSFTRAAGDIWHGLSLKPDPMTSQSREALAAARDREHRFGNSAVTDSARSYVQNQGIRPDLPETSYVKNSPIQGEIANVYDSLVSNPDDPAVRASYAALERETRAQFRHLTDQGFQFEPYYDPGSAAGSSPFHGYDNSQQMRDDVAGLLDWSDGTGVPRPRQPGERGAPHLWVYADYNEHPLLSPPGTPYDQSANWMFRAVHDVFGHAGRGVDFGPRGEENAWVEHVKMFTPEAARAMTTETRGQNSWVNFFDNHADLPIKERPYAEQKAVILPDQYLTRPDAYPQYEEPSLLLQGTRALGRELIGGTAGAGVGLATAPEDASNQDRINRAATGALGGLALGRLSKPGVATSWLDNLTTGSPLSAEAGAMVPGLGIRQVRQEPMFHPGKGAVGEILPSDVTARQSATPGYTPRMFDPRTGEFYDNPKAVPKSVRSPIRAYTEEALQNRWSELSQKYGPVSQQEQSVAQNILDTWNTTDPDRTQAVDEWLGGGNRISPIDNLDIANLRRHFLDKTLEGEAHRFWYRNTAEAMRTAFQGDLQAAGRFIGLLAIYSPQRDIPENTRLAEIAYSQFHHGLLVTAGQPWQQEAATRFLSDQSDIFERDLYTVRTADDPDAALKTSTFFRNMMKYIAPQGSLAHTTGWGPSQQGTQSTIDVWIGKSAGIPQDNPPTPAAYRAVDDLLVSLLDDLNRLRPGEGWTPDQIQAAIWVPTKAAWERREIPEAGLHYGGGLQQGIVQTNTEFSPDADPLLLQAYRSAAPEERLAYEDKMAQRVLSDQGQNRFAREIGLPVDPSSPLVTTGTGFWREGGQTYLNRGLAQRVPGARSSQSISTSTLRRWQESGGIPGAIDDPRVNQIYQTFAATPEVFMKKGEMPDSIKIPGAENEAHRITQLHAEATAAIYGLVADQSEVPSTMAVRAVTPAKADGARIAIGRPFTLEETQAIAKSLPTGTVPVFTYEGVWLLNKPETKLKNAQFQKAVLQAVGRLDFADEGEAIMSPFQSITYMTGKESGSGKRSFQEALSDTDRLFPDPDSNPYRRVLRDMLSERDTVRQEMASEYGSQWLGGQ